MSVNHSERVIRRLRAHRLVPGGALVTLVTAGAFAPDGSRVAWLAVNPETGASYAGSLFTVRQVAESREWQLSRGRHGGLAMVTPVSAGTLRLAGSVTRQAGPGRGHRR